MAVGGVITDEGRNALWNRAGKAIPNNTAFTQFTLGTDNTTPAVTDTYASITGTPGGFPKNVTIGFPYFDTTNKKMQVQGYVSPSEANGLNVSSFALVNTDGTPKTLSHDVVTAISKTSSIEIIFNWISKLM